MRATLAYPDLDDTLSAPDTRFALSTINLDFVVPGLEHSVNIGPIGTDRLFKNSGNVLIQCADLGVV